MSNTNTVKKLTLVSLVLMIFTSVYGFNNIPRSFYKMGYAAIPWYILSAITFFVPFALMVAEFGSAFKEEKGGIYSRGPDWSSYVVEDGLLITGQNPGSSPATARALIDALSVDK